MPSVTFAADSLPSRKRLSIEVPGSDPAHVVTPSEIVFADDVKKAPSEFEPSGKGKGPAILRGHSKARKRTALVGRAASPPPSPTFRRRITFDTLDPQHEPRFCSKSLCLMRTHKHYEHSKTTRTFLCGLDDNKYSAYALEWLIDELVDDGDEIVCFRVVEKDAPVASERNIEEKLYRTEAETLMQSMQEKNVEDRAINLILEFSIGKVQDIIEDLIKVYEPAMLIVGTRGRSLGGFQGLLPGSVSKWVLQHSPVPVIVVRPNSKRAKTKRKRLKDPARTGYKDLLDKSNPDGSGHLLDHSNRYSIVPMSLPATEAEAAAVAAAITGHFPNLTPALGKGDGRENPSQLDAISETSDSDEEDDIGVSMAITMDSRSERIMKSPEQVAVELPELGDVSDEAEGDGGSLDTMALAPDGEPGDEDFGNVLSRMSVSGTASR